MKNIFLLRHAHAAQSQGNDFDRPLSEAGVLKCLDISLSLKPYIKDVDLILSSLAVRTKQTIENILQNLQIDKEISFTEELYNASVNEIFQQIITLADKNNTVLIVSHNPAISELARFLAQDDQSLEVLQGFSPGSLALLTSKASSWQNFDPGNIELKEFWR